MNEVQGHNTLPSLATMPSLSKSGKKRRSHVTKACVNCQRAHVSCEATRPCKRCLDRGKSCMDGEAKRRGRKKISGSPLEASPENGIMSYKDDLTGVEPSSILASISTKGVTFSNSGLPNYNTFMNSTLTNYGQDLDLAAIQQQAISDLPMDIFQDMFLFSPFENLESMRLKPVSLINPSLGIPEKNETPSTFSRVEFFYKMKENLQKRLPEKLFLFEKAMAFREQLAKIREGLTEEAVLTMRRDFDTYLTTFSAVFDQLGVPSLIWERCGVIHYVSKGYVELTGFNDPVPTNLADLAFAQQLSTDGLRGYVDGISQIFLYTGGTIRNDTFTFPSGIKIAGSSNYIEGTMCVTIKRDMIGLPLIFIGNFLPYKKNQ